MTHRITNQWNNKLHVKYELTLFFGAIGLLNPRISSNDLVQDEGDYQRAA
jgi:hypothetical protein